MLVLSASTDLIQVVTSATGSVLAHASWEDIGNDRNHPGTRITRGRNNVAAITTATTTTIVAGNASDLERDVRVISVRNNHTSTSNTVAVQHTDGTTAVVLWKGPLAAGESVVLDDINHWTHYDAYGSPIVVSSAQAPTTDAAPVDAVAATGTITDGNASDYDVNQTITINGKEYKFKSALTVPAVEGEVLIGGTADSSLNKLVQAINRNTQLGTPGVDYNVAAAHPNVTAGAVGSHASILTAKVKGVVGNDITLAKAGAYGSVSGAKLANGIDGTTGSARDIRIVSGQPYICLADSTTISTGTWKKITVASL